MMSMKKLERRGASEKTMYLPKSPTAVLPNRDVIRNGCCERD